MKKVFALFFILVLCFFKADRVLAAPPSNFQSTLKIGSGLTNPTGFDIAPDGRIFILQRTGEVKIYKNGQLLASNFTVLPTVDTGDRGLIGIAFDPDFINNHFVYFYYTDTDLTNKLIRFDASGDTATSGPFILYQTPDQSFQLHVGGTVQFGLDGKIYLSIGDNGFSGNSQDLSNVHGKILRLNKDGSVPTDNPFVGRSGVTPEIYAYGLRNPFRFQFDSVTGNLLEGDVGEATWEEINLIKAGKNYGWPNCEGVCTPSNVLYTDPIYTYNHNNASAAVVGGPIYHGQLFPSNYQGSLFFGDYAMGFIKTMALDSNGNNLGVSDFDLTAGSVVDMKVDRRDGSLYYLTIFPGRLYQVTYSTGVKVPVASASSDVMSGSGPLSVHFSSNGSSDPNGFPLTYNWDFGDSTASNSANPTKTYTTNGKYVVQLTVNNGTYSALASPIVIQVGTPPKVTISSPTNGATYRAGDTINYSASAIDGSGNALPNSSLSTTVVFHHQTHIHPFLGPISGGTGQFTIPTTGEGSPDTWYEIDVTATDTSGLTSTSSTLINPIKSTITFTSNVAGLSILLDGQPTLTPTTVQGVVNFIRVLSAPFLQVVNGVVYSFHQWSDGGAYRHTIAVQNTDTSYSATFDQTTPFIGQYYTNMTLSGNPTLTRQDNIINFNWATTPPDPSIPHDHYSVRWTKTQYFPAGRYIFTQSTDDGGRLFIDNNTVIDNWVDQGVHPVIGTADLTAGNHTIRMEYYQNAGGAVASLSWEYAQVQPSGVPSPTLTPTPAPTRLGGLNLDGYCNSQGLTGGASPSGNNWICNGNGSTITMTNACVWQYKPTAFALQDVVGNPYSWSCYGTAGIPTTTPTPTSTPTPTATPTPTPTPGPQSGYTGKYWNLPTTTHYPPTIPTSAPTLSRLDNAINFTWNNGSPDPKITPDNFVAQWTSTQTFAAGSYLFSSTSDDGMRVYLDNTLIINQWSDHASQLVTSNQILTTGSHAIRVEYYEHKGGAIAKFSFQKI